MLTKKDISQLLESLKKVFATKQEAKRQHTVVIQRLDRIQEDLSSLTEVTGNILSWTDDIHKEMVSEKLPQRVHRLEKHLGYPVLAD